MYFLASSGASLLIRLGRHDQIDREILHMRRHQNLAADRAQLQDVVAIQHLASRALLRALNGPLDDARKSAREG